MARIRTNLAELCSAFLARQERVARETPRGLRARQGGWAGWISAGAQAVGVANQLGLFGGKGGGNPGLANAATEQSIKSAQQQDAMSQDLFDYHKENYRPLEQQAIQDAAAAGSPAMLESRAAQAGTTVNAAFDNSQKATDLRQAQLGIRPDSGNTQEMGRENAIARAGSVAAAENTARQDERVYGLNAKTQVAGLGRNLPATALSGESGAATAAGIASSNAARTQQIQDTQAANIGSAI